MPAKSNADRSQEKTNVASAQSLNLPRPLDVCVSACPKHLTGSATKQSNAKKHHVAERRNILQDVVHKLRAYLVQEVRIAVVLFFSHLNTSGYNTIVAVVGIVEKAQPLSMGCCKPRLCAQLPFGTQYARMRARAPTASIDPSFADTCIFQLACYNS